MSAEAEEIEETSATKNAGNRRAGKLFLGGVGYETTEPMLEEHFAQYGELVEVAILRDRSTGRPRGFGFVTFKDPAAAEEAVKDVHFVDGREIDVKKSVPQESRGRARKIFVGGLSPETTEESFKEYFGKFGSVAEVQIMVDHMSGRSRGFGFVTFEEDGAAERVFESGNMHEIGGKQVEVKPATPKGAGPQGSGAAGGHAGGRSVGRSGRSSGGAGELPHAAMMPPFGAAAGTPGATTFPPFMAPYGAHRPGVAYAPHYGMQYHGIPPQYMMQYPGMHGTPYVTGTGNTTSGTAVHSYGTYPTHSGFAVSPPTPSGATGPLPYTHQGSYQQQGHGQGQQQQYQRGGGYHGGASGRAAGSGGSSDVGGGGGGGYAGSPTASPPYVSGGVGGQGRGGRGGKPGVTRSKVDSASSLDQAVEQRMKNLNLD